MTPVSFSIFTVEASSVFLFFDITEHIKSFFCLFNTVVLEVYCNILHRIKPAIVLLNLFIIPDAPILDLAVIRLISYSHILSENNINLSLGNEEQPIRPEEDL